MAAKLDQGTGNSERQHVIGKMSFREVNPVASNEAPKLTGNNPVAIINESRRRVCAEARNRRSQQDYVQSNDREFHPSSDA